MDLRAVTKKKIKVFEITRGRYKYFSARAPRTQFMNARRQERDWNVTTHIACHGPRTEENRNQCRVQKPDQVTKKPIGIISWWLIT